MRRALQKLLSLAIVLTMVLTMVPAVDVSAATGTAWSGGTFPKNGTYYLAGDVTLTEEVTISSSRTITLDLNGHTLTAAENGRAFYLNGGKLTVKDSGDGGTIQGNANSVVARGGAIYVKGSAGVLTLESGTITGGSVTDRGGNIYVENGTFNMTGGTVSNGYAADRGGNIASTGKLNLSGGIVTAGTAGSYGGNLLSTGMNCIINISGTAQITNGTAKNGGNIMLMYSSLNMSGGTVSGGVSTTYGSNLHTYGGSEDYCTINISGGLIDKPGATAKASSMYLTGGDNTPCLVNISGGRLNDRVYVASTISLTLSGAPVIENLYLRAGNLVTPTDLTAGADIAVTTETGYTEISGLLTDASRYLPYFSSNMAGYSVGVINNRLTMVPGCECGCGTAPENVVWTDLTGYTGGELTSGHYFVPEAGLTLTEQFTVAADEVVTLDLRGSALHAAANARAFYLAGTLNVMDSSPDKDGKLYGGTLTDAEYGGTIYMTTGGQFYLYSGEITGGTANRGGNLYIASGSNVVEFHGGSITGGVATAISSTTGRGGNIYMSNGTLLITGDAVVSGGDAQRWITDATGANNSARGGNLWVTGGTCTINGNAQIRDGLSGQYGGNIMFYTCTAVLGGNAQIFGGNAEKYGNNVVTMNADVTFAENIYVDAAAEGDSAYSTYFHDSASGASITNVVTIAGGTLEGTTQVSKVKELHLSGSPVVQYMNILTGMKVTSVALTEGAEITVKAADGSITEAFETAAENAGYFKPYQSGYTVAVGAGALVYGLACDCGCGDLEAYVNWKSWSGAAISEGGHYKLSKSVTAADQITVEAGTHVTVDLNGYTLTAASGKRVFLVNGSLTVMDSRSGGTITGGKAQGSSSDSTGDGGNIFVGSGATFTLRSGTITSGNALRYGGNLSASSNSVVYIYGGTISNGVSDARGGNIYLGTYSRLYMHDGVLKDGTTATRGGNLFSNYGVAYFMGGTVSGGQTTGNSNDTYGGNLMTTGLDSAIHISGSAKISKGNAGTGSTIALMYGNLYVSGGTIVDGTIYSTESSSQNYSGMYFSGGTIGCSTITAAGDASDGRGTLIAITGGTFTGTFKINSAVNVILSGAPSMANLTLGSDVRVTPVDLTAIIPLTATGAFTTKLENAEDYIDFFEPSSGSVINEDGVLVVRSTSSSGTSGNVKWNLSSDGVLTITGSGTMSNYYYYSSSLTNIPWKSYLSSIKKVVVGEGVTSLGNNAFYGCTKLTEVVLPSTITSIGNYAFYNCSKLATVELPGKLTSIGQYAFATSGLTEIVIPDSVTRIQAQAFLDCANLTTVTLGTGLTSIGSDAFSDCTALQVVNYRGTEAQWDNITLNTGNTALTGATISYSYNNSGITFHNLVWSINSSGVLTVTGSGEMPGYYRQATFSEFKGAPWLAYADQITAVVVNGYTTIGEWVFYDLDNLTSVTISNSVTRIEANAFRDCDKLTSVTIPASVTWIGANAFYSCDKLATLSLGSKVKTIDSFAFYDCDKLASVTIPAAVTVIGAKAFAECDALTSISVNSSNANYASVGGALLNKAKTTLLQVPAGLNGSYTTPNTVTTIGDNAFEGCKTLTDVVITDNVQTVGKAAFFGTSVTTVTLGSGVSAIATNAFNACDDLLGFALSSTNATYAVDAVGALYTADGKTLLQVPGGISGTYAVANTAGEIGSKAMAWNKNATQVIVPDSVTTIGTYAFVGAAFKTLDMTYATNSVKKGAFECAGLQTVNYIGTEQNWAEIAIASYNTPLKNAKLVRIAGGVISETLRWDVTDSGVLTISGTGELPAYKTGMAPWYVNSNGITAIAIGEGITGISANAFYGCTAVKEVYLPVSLQTIGENAFAACTGITTVNYAGTRYQWNGVTVNDGNTTLTNATFNYSVATLTTLAIKTMPTKLTYLMGETLDTTGLVLLLTYSDGSTEEVTALTEEYKVEADLTNRGTATVTITYKEKSVTYTVDVEAAGTCGENVTWRLVDGVLTLSGTGEMTYYDAKTDVPWWNLKEEVTSIVVEAGITGRLSRFAFYQCANATSVSLPEGITFLGSSAFFGCSSLEEIKIPDSVTGISSTTFGSNTSLKTVSFGEQLTSIGDGAFKNCTSLTTVNYGGSRRTWNNISISATNNEALTSATINYAVIEPVAVIVSKLPDKTEYLVGQTLDLTGMVLTTVYEDDSEAEYTGEYTVDCALNAVGTVQATVTAGEFTATFSVTVLEGGTTAEGMTWYRKGATLYIEHEGAMPDYSDENPAPWVTNYESNAFNAVVFSGNITSIGAYAFVGCYDLTNVVLPETVTAIGEGAFKATENLESITIGVNVTTIGDNAFANSNLTTVYYGGNSVTWKLVAVGQNNEALTGANFVYGMAEPIGMTITKLPAKTEYLLWETPDFTGLELSYVMEDGTEIPCVEEFDVPSGTLAGIGKNSFSVTVGEHIQLFDLTVLPSGYCSDDGESLRWSIVDGKLTISGTGEITYYGSKELVPWWNYKTTVTSAVIEPGMTGRLTRFAFYNCSNMESVSLPEGVTYLGSSALYGCSSLKEIVIPNSVTGMSSTVFGNNTSLTTVTMGEAVVEIGSGAFKGCTSLATVYYGGSRTTFAKIKINDTDNSCFTDATIHYARVDVTKLEITKQPAKLVYLRGDALDTEGLELTAYLDDGSQQVVQDYQAEADLDQIGEVTVTVRYQDKTVTYAISVGDGGYTADGLFWQYMDGVLTVDYLVDEENPGTGAMQDYTAESPAPWAEYAKDIETLVIGEDVTTIGTYAFAGLSAMTSLVIPESMTAIGENAFLNCDQLEALTFTGEQEAWSAIEIAKTGNDALLAVAPELNVTAGDINGDGNVDFKDLGTLQSYLSGKAGNVDEAAADVNGDSTIDFKDLGSLQAMLSGKAAQATTV